MEGQIGSAAASPVQSVFRPVYRGLSDAEKALMLVIKTRAEDLLASIESCVPGVPSPKGRYVALAKTALEESVMWAVKAITL